MREGLVETFNFKPLNVNGLVLRVIFDREIATGLTHQEVVHGLRNKLAARRKFVVNIAKTNDDFRFETGLFGNLANCGLLKILFALGVPLWHTPVNAAVSAHSPNQGNSRAAIRGENKATR
jgi:hypothetical protein